MKVIVTGFGPFGAFEVNPSQEAVLGLPDNVKFDDKSTNAEVAKLILPTCCISAYEIIEKEVEACKDKPFALLMCGLADGRDKISLERFALNVRDFPIPDNNGHQWQEDHINVDAPDALRSNVKLRELSEHLKQAGFGTEISSHAGTYVCNETYYRSLLSWQANPNCHGILFVHVPSYASYKQPESNSDPAMSRQIYSDALAKIAAFLAR